MGADLAALCREAALAAIRRYSLLSIEGLQHDRSLISSCFAGTEAASSFVGPPSNISSGFISCSPSSISLSSFDFEQALGVVGPSTRTTTRVAVSQVSWADIGGLSPILEHLRQLVEWPLLYPGTFLRLGITPPRGLLLYGPPGCSKTTMVKAIACSVQASFFALSGAAVYSPFVGEAERTVRATFAQARAGAPSVLFLDEVYASNLI